MKLAGRARQMAAVVYAPRGVENVHKRTGPMTRDNNYEVRRHEQPQAEYVRHINTHISYLLLLSH